MHLQLSIAVGDYDRTRPLFDGAVGIDGVDPVFIKLEPEEMFFRAMRYEEFDVSELSLSSFLVKTAQGRCPYVGVPVFLSRAFRHNSIYVRNDRGIRTPQDLKGRRVGLGEYQLTACVWARILLEDEYGVRPGDIQWVRGGVESPERSEKISLDLPSDIRIESAPPGVTLDEMLAAGDIDAFIGPRAPPSFEQRHPNIERLFVDSQGEATDYFNRTGIFPIMHILGVRRELVERHPWLPATLFKAFEESKRSALAKLNDASVAKVTLPFVEEQLRAARQLLGEDFWSYGIQPNLNVLNTFFLHHQRQGLSNWLLTVEEVFHSGTFEVATI